jgi:hypothetical protein
MRVLVVIACFFFMQSFLFSQDFTSSNQQWIHYYSQIDLNQKNRIGFDGGFRWKDGFSEPALFLVRASYWRKVRPNFSLGFGVAHTEAFSQYRIKTLELRPYQELLYLKKKDRSSVQIRFRFEERFFADLYEGEVSSNRFIFSYTFFLFNPLKKIENTGLYFFFGEEIFMNLKLNSETNWFDQNRLMAGPVLKLNQKLTLQLIYSLQIASTFQSDVYKLTHVSWLSLRHSLDFSKKETIE